MRKIDAPRDEIREAVLAALHRQTDEEARKKRRLCELAGLPYDPKEEIHTQVLYSFLVEPYVNNLMGAISDEEFLAKVKDVFKEYITSQIRKAEKEEEELLGEKEQPSRTAMAMIDGLLAYVLPPNYQEKGWRYWEYAFELAKEKGIAPKDIFASDDLCKEVLRHTYTREETQANIEKASSFLNPDTLLDIMFKPMIKTLAEDEEEAAELLNELKEEMQSDPEFQEKMEALKNAFHQVVGEEIERIYG